MPVVALPYSWLLCAITSLAALTSSAGNKARNSRTLACKNKKQAHSGEKSLPSSFVAWCSSLALQLRGFDKERRDLQFFSNLWERILLRCKKSVKNHSVQNTQNSLTSAALVARREKSA